MASSFLCPGPEDVTLPEAFSYPWSGQGFLAQWHLPLPHEPTDHTVRSPFYFRGYLPWTVHPKRAKEPVFSSPHIQPLTPGFNTKGWGWGHTTNGGSYSTNGLRSPSGPASHCHVLNQLQRGSSLYATNAKPPSHHQYRAYEMGLRVPARVPPPYSPPLRQDSE